MTVVGGGKGGGEGSGEGGGKSGRSGGGVAALWCEGDGEGGKIGWS